MHMRAAAPAAAGLWEEGIHACMLTAAAGVHMTDRQAAAACLLQPILNMLRSNL